MTYNDDEKEDTTSINCPNPNSPLGIDDIRKIVIHFNRGQMFDMLCKTGRAELANDIFGI